MTSMVPSLAVRFQFLALSEPFAQCASFLAVVSEDVPWLSPARPGYFYPTQCRIVRSQTYHLHTRIMFNNFLCSAVRRGVANNYGKLIVSKAANLTLISPCHPLQKISFFIVPCRIALWTIPMDCFVAPLRRFRPLL